MSHTPGPWKVGGNSFEWNSPMSPRVEILRRVTFVDGATPTTYRIGYAVYPTTSEGTVGAEERKANARLIAAAPQLLEALQALVNSDMAMREEYEGNESAELNAARAAIAAATGAA